MYRKKDVNFVSNIEHPEFERIYKGIGEDQFEEFERKWRENARRTGTEKILDNDQTHSRIENDLRRDIYQSNNSYLRNQGPTQSVKDDYFNRQHSYQTSQNEYKEPKPEEQKKSSFRETRTTSNIYNDDRSPLSREGIHQSFIPSYQRGPHQPPHYQQPIYHHNPVHHNPVHHNPMQHVFNQGPPPIPSFASQTFSPHHGTQHSYSPHHNSPPQQTFSTYNTSSPHHQQNSQNPIFFPPTPPGPQNSFPIGASFPPPPQTPNDNSPGTPSIRRTD